jgi:hypothetical protein
VFTRRVFGIAILALAGAGCATWQSPPEEAIDADSAALDCINTARRVTQTFDGRPRLTIDHDRYQRCLSDRRQTVPPPER